MAIDRQKQKEISMNLDNHKNELLNAIYFLNLPMVKIIKPTKKELKDKYNKSYYHDNSGKGHKCIICESKFYYGKFNKNQTEFCCGECKIEFTCPYCKEIFVIKTSDLNKNAYNFLIECIKNNELNKFYKFCSKGHSSAFKNKLQYMRKISGENIKNWGDTHKKNKKNLVKNTAVKIYKNGMNQRKGKNLIQN